MAGSSAAVRAFRSDSGPEATVPDLKSAYCARWWDTACDTPVLGPAVSRRQQRDNAREAERLLEDVATSVERYPDAEDDRRRLREELQARVRRFGAERLGWPRGYHSLLFAEEFFRSTREFVREARAFDSAVRPDDVLQALRNVWIANSLQMLLDLPVRLTPSVFAYSMLYPWTDNYLDDPRVPAEAKAAFNDALTRRLAGEPCRAAGRHERQVFELVARIESEHSRSTRPRVYESLRAIQRAQIASLVQQTTGGPYEADLLGLSVEKGGASVLTDACLVAGTLDPGEAEFAFGYGVFLQLLDDLQDARRDRAVGHMTVFSQTAGRWPLDRLASRLYRLIGRVVEESARFSGERYDERLDLVRRNCNLLLVGAVAENEDLFSRAFTSALEERWPVDFASLRRLRRRAARRQRRTSARLRRARGVTSLFDLV
jgi:hypothetical protein